MTSQMSEGVIPPPSGVTPDFEHPVNKNDTTVYVLSSVGMFVCTVCLIMRVYTKSRIQRMFGVEDICIISAWACSIATQGIIIYSFGHAGEGIHLWEMTKATFSAYQKFILVASVIYVPCLAFAKLSLLLLYHRLSPQKRFRVATYVLMVVVLGYSIALIFTLIFSCHPIQRGWDATLTTGYCINRPAVYLATAIINIVTDLGILVIPIPMVLALRMPLIQKIGLMLMFVVGSATVITSIVRLVTLLPLLTAADQSWAVATPAMWIIVEANLVIICGCLPTIRQFLRRFAPRWIGEGNSWARHHNNDANNSPGANYPSHPSHTYNNSESTYQDRKNSYSLQDTYTSRHSRYNNFSRPDTYGKTRLPDERDSDAELVDELVRGAPSGMGMRTEWPIGVATRMERKGSDDGSEKTVIEEAEAVHLGVRKGNGLET